MDSSTVISLSLGQLLSIGMTLIGIIGTVIAWVKKDERDKARLDQNEKDISRVNSKVDKLTESVQELVVALHSRKNQPTTP